MSYELEDLEELDVQTRASDEVETASPSKVAPHASGHTNSTTVPARSWAWAHGTESYDWMDSHSPFPVSTSSD